jgi:RNA polymerase sigma-70 factor (ECF subfamily)
VPDGALSDAPDALLVSRSTEGDSRAFEVLLRRYSRMMRAYARRLTGSDADADDVVQDAFITAWNSLEALQDAQMVKSWLMRIVSRKAIDLIRSRRSESGLDGWDVAGPASVGPEYHALLHSQLTDVGKVLASLPELQRQCWILKEIGGYSYQDIADELGAPLPTVRGALSRARISLVRGMEGWA